jgi:hypothetical protein
MQLPFTHQQFLEVFATYHRLFGPAVLLSWLATLAVLVLWWRRGATASPVVAGLLAFHWGWSGLAYHFALFRAINPAAGMFALMFVAQAVLFLWTGVIRRRLVFTPARRGWGAVGLAAIAYTMAYPVIVLLSGLSFPAMPTFGVPCPTTLLTAGLILFLEPPAARAPAAITIAWSAIGGSAAFLLGMRADLALPVAGGLVLVSLMRSLRRPRQRDANPAAAGSFETRPPRSSDADFA